jgi:hypothetical protein
MRSALALPLLAVIACGPPPEDAPVDAPVADPDAEPPAPDAEPPGPDAMPVDFSLVYAHSGQALYRLDTSSLAPVEIGPFLNTGTQSITDIAVDKNDVMLGVTLDKIYTIDTATGEATLLRQLDAGVPNLTSLSFVPVDLDDPDSAEILVAAADDGTVLQIDPADGTATQIGSYGMAGADIIRSSGDIVAVRGLGIFATVNVGADVTLPDHLASIDPTTWAATPIGTGTSNDRIFGVGFWRGTVYGFVDLGNGVGGAIITIDRVTGTSTIVDQGTIRWFGAGVTTNAPVVD